MRSLANPRTLTALAVLTNPLVWLAACVGAVFVVWYVVFLYVQQEMRVGNPGREEHRPPIPLPLPVAAPEVGGVEGPPCHQCGIALPGDSCTVCGTPKIITVVEQPSGGAGEVVSPLVAKPYKSPGKTQIRGEHACAAQAAPEKVARARSRPKKGANSKSKKTTRGQSPTGRKGKEA